LELWRKKNCFYTFSKLQCCRKWR